VIPQPYWDRFHDDEIDMPRVRLDPAALDPHSRRLRHVCGMDLQAVTEAQMRAARHAYYGALSFVDDQVASVLDTLRDCGLHEDTIVLLLADHGEMLGERGLWYKMSFFEGSCRVPLMVHAPGRFRPRRVAEAVSLADLLPTLAAFGADGDAPESPGPVEGRSLLPHLHGTGGHDEVRGEYLAEGAVAPIVMLRRGHLKFVRCPADPDQLYDLHADPDERVNLAGAPAAAGLREAIARLWDLDTLHQRVLESQRRRRFVHRALRAGAYRGWDWQPFEDAGQKYMRSHMKLDELEAAARFPRVPSPRAGE
jgi:choline-sulfatase